MKPKQTLKILVDAGMTLGLLFSMSYQFWGDAAHEWVGAGMLVLFVLHHVLNWNWWENLFRGRYTPLRVLTVVIDLLVLLAMLGLMVSGILLSRHVFSFLSISGGTAFARLLHMVSAYWGFVLMALHIGLHWGMLTGMIRKAGGTLAFRPNAVVFSVLGAATAIYGLTALFRRELPTYLFLRTQFVFLDSGESKVLFYLDYLAMMGLFICLSHYAAGMAKYWHCRKHGKREAEEECRMQTLP